MQLIVDHSALRNALHLCGTARGSQQIIPILANVLLTAKDDSLTIASTDLELTVIVKLETMVREAGSVTAPLSSLTDIAKTATDPLSMTTTTNGRLEITTGSAKYALPTMPAEDYPTLPDMSEVDSESGEIELSTSEILAMLNTVSYAADAKDSTLHGVFVQVDPKSLAVCAMMGHRLAMCEIAGKFEKKAAMLWPMNIVESARKLSDEGAMLCAWTRNHVSVKSDGTELIARRPDAQFREFRNYIPKDGLATFSINAQRLALAANRVAPFASGSRAIRCTLTPKIATLTAENDSRGASSDEVPTTYEGIALPIGFDGGLLAEAFEHIDTEDATMSPFNTKTKDGEVIGGVVLRPVDSALPFTATHLVMAMAL